ncbi:hypothetical protein AX15_001913 [Amanita polypyramis BW_CC]|nr:hypothetical protein AX15_001913 [Amanita polypyramis BW_CC]
MLSEVQEAPIHDHRSVFRDFAHGIDPATEAVLGAAEEAFTHLEYQVEETLEYLLHQLRSNSNCRELHVERTSVDVLRRYFAFLRFRNSRAYKDVIRHVRRLADDRTQQCGIIYSVYLPLISQLHLRVILRKILAFLTSDGISHVKSGAEHEGTSVTMLRHFHETMEAYCWALRDAEICFGIALDEQEFLLPDTCYGALAESYQENPDCRDFFFPFLPTIALYLLGSDRLDTKNEEVITVSVGTEYSTDVHLRNAMVLNSYPEQLYFNSLRATTLTLSSYDEFRWIQEHQDYSRLKQRCRQKFLQQCVTKTLVIKGSFALIDLTDEIELIGDCPVGFGSFSDVWKGFWKDQVERREKKVAVKFLRNVVFKEPQKQLIKHLQAECLAWHRLCHRHVNQLYGLLQTSHSIGMVSQWCENGTITEYITKHAVDKIKLLVQVASGMAYLHSCQPVVVHGDLKGGNILIDEYGCAIISDFGLSKVMEGVMDKRVGSTFAGSMRWMAPELIFALVEDEGESPPLSTYSDAYAFGARPSTMAKDAASRLPWDQLKAGTMRSLCRDLGLKLHNTTRLVMTEFLETVSKVGLPKALHNVSAPGESSSLGARSSRKRTRESNAALSESVNEVTPARERAEQPSPPKQYHISIVSDYNTRFKADRRGRLSDPGPVRRRGLASGEGSSLSALVSRAGRRKRRSATGAGPGSGVTSARRRVRLGEPVSSKTPEEDADGEGKGIGLSSPTFFRRALAPASRVSAKEGEDGSPAKKRRVVSMGKRTVRANGPVEEDEQEQMKRGRKNSTTKRARTRGRKISTTAKAVGKAHRKSSRSTGKTHPRSDDHPKMVFDGIDVPPLSKAIFVAMKKKEVVLGDEDADGELDEEVQHRAEAEREAHPVEDETMGKEDAPRTEGDEDGMAVDQYESTIPAGEEGDEDYGEIEGLIPDDISSLGNSNKENEAPEEQLDDDNHEQEQEQTMDMDAIDAGVVTATTITATETTDAADMEEDIAMHAAAAAALFGSSVAVSTTILSNEYEDENPANGDGMSQFMTP